MDSLPNCLNGISSQKTRIHIKAQHITNASIFRVPVSRDLRGVLRVQYRVKERLLG